MSNRKRLWTPSGHRQQEPQPEVKVIEGTGRLIRLWVCRECKSIEELPPYDGDPRNDILLEEIASRHMTEWRTHECSLVKVPENYWKTEKIRDQIVKQLSQGGSKGLAEIDEDYYATKDTYREDALKCFDAHHRPKGADCIDWKDSSKRIGNPTREGWKTGAKVYLCHFCPVRAQVERAKRGEIASG